MARAGDSAGREYDRRRRKDRETRRRNFKWSLILFLLTPFVVFYFVQGVALAANQWLLSTMFRQFGAEGPQEVVDPSTTKSLGIMLAGVATLRMGVNLWGARPTTESWRRGQEGEVRTGRALDALPQGYIVLHDLRMPGSRTNIDHVVIGPTGVFTVETKNYSSDVVVRRGVARHAGHSMAKVVQQAKRQAEALATALDRGVNAVVCVQGALVRVEGMFSKPVVDGVRFCSGRRVVGVITGGNRWLPQDEINELAALAEQRLGRAPGGTSGPEAQTCRCGGTLVLRHRRADGSPFWGCSRYPSCRTTRPA
ncbi:MAG TPA: NERD domain-containing protein [Acidimicrobiales bacterium]|nr:NERD domain-containing protein [Acidimicrobiales bacterium]